MTTTVSALVANKQLNAKERKKSTAIAMEAMKEATLNPETHKARHRASNAATPSGALATASGSGRESDIARRMKFAANLNEIEEQRRAHTSVDSNGVINLLEGVQFEDKWLIDRRTSRWMSVWDAVMISALLFAATVTPYEVRVTCITYFSPLQHRPGQIHALAHAHYLYATPTPTST